MMKLESTTLPSFAFTSSNRKSTDKVKRQYQFPFARQTNYSPFVGDVSRQNTDTYAQTINQLDHKDKNGNFNYA